ncbi:hypothetical protein JXB31_00475 [Candidatus Woesearchaeota archaeon]|nr:hypothetical protein [Candidatus Woesearchaeota archaeon]
MKQSFLKHVEDLNYLLENRPREEKRQKRILYDKDAYYKKSLENAVEKIRATGFALAGAYGKDKANRESIRRIIDIIQGDFIEKIAELKRLCSSIRPESALHAAEQEIKIRMPDRMPPEIKPDIIADLRELERSFNSGCFRAATILCGRILETCLHRKYFEATGNDILEKNPGIGLGKLIAKLAEKNISFDPGLTQQIHLINQVRVYSVHVKKDSFYPTKQQTHAMVLYTLDAIGKMF